MRQRRLAGRHGARIDPGEFTVTALSDGAIAIDTARLRHTAPALVKRLLARAGQHGPEVPTAVNAYLTDTGSLRVLVDAGSGDSLGPGLGRLIGNLRAAGHAPQAIDLVLLTHLHPDHADGLLASDGSAAFPDARIRLARAESDYWLSEARARAAPEKGSG